MDLQQQSGVLAGKTVLLIEDEYFLAEEIRRALLKQGASVVGPFGDVAQGLAAVEAEKALTGAVLDINLRNETVYPIADALRRRGLPFVFTTGYDKAAIPEHYQDIPRCEKPIDITALVRALAEF